MRTINEIVVHCTATPEGRAVSVAEIDAWHRARKWSGIGYHRVVHLDGRVEDGRPIERIGAHVAGRNANTVGLVYVGGVAADGKTPKDTRTPAQKAALVEEIKRLRVAYGVKQVSGHNQYAAKACPSFDALAEYGYLFEGDALVFEPANDAVLQRGHTGPLVAAWIEDLATYRDMIDHPFPVPLGAAFDHTIEMVTIWFQNARDIVADGKVGPQTVDEMARALAGKPPFQAMLANDDDQRLAAAVHHIRAALGALTAA